MSASDGVDAASYVYDALGRRVKRTKGTDISKFTHDGQDVVLDDENTVITTYQNGAGTDNKLSIKNGSNRSYVLGDHLGSTNGLADQSGAVTSSAAYDSFGNQTGTQATRYAFTGREHDDFTVLMYYRARMYDPALGRFISEDPIGFKGGDVNLYGYVHNNPINKKDPLGLIDLGWGSPTGPAVPYSNLPQSQCTCEDQPAFKSPIPGTVQLGLGGNAVLGVIPFVGSIGLAFDTSGNVGAYSEGGSGVGLGLDGTVGGQIIVTNASTIHGLNGPFVNPGVGLGNGIVGGGLLLGAGGGADYSATLTGTKVIPLFNIPELWRPKRCRR